MELDAQGISAGQECMIPGAVEDLGHEVHVVRRCLFEGRDQLKKMGKHRESVPSPIGPSNGGRTCRRRGMGSEMSTIEVRKRGDTQNPLSPKDVLPEPVRLEVLSFISGH
jgi:hypothetical protein